MKFFDSRRKLAVTFSLVAVLMTGSLAYAASAVKQDAYYDTFRFVVNGSDQNIADQALKPFIANSRVYVPMATLNSLNVADVRWTPSSGGASAVLTISPKSTVDPMQVTALQAQNAALQTQLNTKIEENKKLTEEVNALKDDLSKSKTSTSSGTLDDRKVRDLNDRLYNTVYRTPFDPRYGSGSTAGSLNLRFDANATAYRNELDIELTTRDFDQTKWNSYVQSATARGAESDLYTFVDRNIIREATNEFRDMRDLRINVYIYGGDRNSRNKIATGTYDRERLDVRLN